MRRGGCAPARRLALRARRHHARHRGRPGTLRRGQAPQGGRCDPRPADPQHGLLLREPAGPLRRQPRGPRGRHRGPARHQRRREEHAAAGRGGAGPPPPRGHPHLRGQLHLPRARADHRPRRRAARRREDDVPRPERAGEHPRRRPLLPARDTALEGGLRRRHRPLPRAPVPPRPARRHLVGRRATDAGAGARHDEQAPSPHDRRARLRPRPHDGRAPHGHRQAGQRRGSHRHPRRAEREPRHDPRRPHLLPRARRGPLRRFDHGPPVARRPAAPGVPGQRGRGAGHRHGRHRHGRRRAGRRPDERGRGERRHDSCLRPHRAHGPDVGTTGRADGTERTNGGRPSDRNPADLACRRAVGGRAERRCRRRGERTEPPAPGRDGKDGKNGRDGGTA